MDTLPPVAKQAVALTLGVICGFLAYAINMPLGWMLGPMIGCTIAALMQAPILPPIKLRPWVMPVIGVLLGSRISSDVLAQALGWWVPALMLIPALLLTAATSYIYYRRVGGFDQPTAFFSAMPGGLTDMIILGTEMGGDERRIAMAHAARVLLVICGVVIFYNLVLGVTAEDAQATWVGLDALTLWDWGVLGICAILGVPLGRFVRLPAGQIMGPMILSGIAHVIGIVEVAPPDIIVIIALLVIGTIIGCRFVGAKIADVRRDLALAAGSSVLMVIIAVVFAVMVNALTDGALSETFLAYSPGGVAEMSLLALAIGQDVTYVTVMHLARIFFVIFGAGFGYRLLAGRDKG